jgi:FAD:protein FMN transferase
MRSFRFPAMGTEVHVLLPAGHGGGIAAVRELFLDWESRLSRFLPESELSHLNSEAGRPVVVGELVFDAVGEALDAARATDGAFDPTLLPQLVRIGYAQSFSRMPRSVEPVTSPPRRGGTWRAITLDPSTRTISLPVGCALDLGGVAKGMAVDASLDLLAEQGVESALVSAGGDLAVRGTPPDAGPWHVFAGDHRSGQVVPLFRGALATSGVARRSWDQGGVRRHHLVDPATGEPASSGLREVTVAAGSCKVAEVAATASFVLGAEAGSDLLDRHGLAGRLTRDDGSKVVVGRWPSPIASAA